MINTKRLYTVATVNGFTHEQVKGRIAFEYGISTTKDLTQEQFEELINYLDKTTEEQIMADKVLAMGLFAKPPRDGAPKFVKGSISVKVEDFTKFLDEHKNEAGWVNIDILEKKDDATKWNGFLNDFKPQSGGQPQSQPKDKPAF